MGEFRYRERGVWVVRVVCGDEAGMSAFWLDVLLAFGTIGVVLGVAAYAVAFFGMDWPDE